MKIVNNADRTIHFEIQAPGSITVWDGDLTKGSNTEKALTEPNLSASILFKTDPPQLAGEHISGLNGQSTLTITQVYCGAVYAG